LDKECVRITDQARVEDSVFKGLAKFRFVRPPSMMLGQAIGVGYRRISKDREPVFERWLLTRAQIGLELRIFAAF
jgi:hypothetical protein